jgi:MFS family permease
VQAGSGGSSYLADFKAGFAYTIKDPFLSVVIPVSVLYNFIFSPTIAVFLPVFAKEEFDSASGLGLIIAAFGAGSAIGTLAYGARGHLISRFWTMMVAVVMLAGAFWLLAAATAIWIGMASLFIAGLAIGPTNVLAMTIVQNNVPEEMLGRVFGFMFAFSSAAAPLGVFLGGFLVEGFGFRAGLIAAAIGATLAMLWVTASSRMRAAMRGFDVQAPETAG